MGAFWPSIPDPLIRAALLCLPSSAVAIETGTYKGNGVALLSKHFDRITSIERDPDLAESARNRFKSNSNIVVVTGSSRDVLVAIMPSDDVPALFWLDAHYSGGITAGSDDKSPLLFEVETILSRRSCANTIIYIDDIRGATGIAGWPTITQISEVAIKNSYEAIVIDDVLILCDEKFLAHFDKIAEVSRASKLSAGNRSWFVISAYLFLIRTCTRVVKTFI